MIDQRYVQVSVCNLYRRIRPYALQPNGQLFVELFEIICFYETRGDNSQCSTVPCLNNGFYLIIFANFLPVYANIYLIFECSTRISKVVALSTPKERGSYLLYGARVGYAGTVRLIFAFFACCQEPTSMYGTVPRYQYQVHCCRWYLYNFITGTFLVRLPRCTENDGFQPV